ncbi:unannotated protein [freshwater metagenome]|uniref:Unannotated protein n=1 Tax=freshwater metagenome TaxID=449393 RepID=A0A6J7KL45_9ZZZZ
MGSINDGRVPVEEVVQCAARYVFVETEQHVDAGRLDVGVDDSDTLARSGELCCQVRAGVALACATTKRVDRDDAGHV